MEVVMKTMTLLVAAVVAVSPAAISAQRGSPGGPKGSMPMNHPMPHTTGSTHGTGWDHMNGPTSTGQPGFECEDVRPGQAASAPGSAFNVEGRAGTRYAGEQPQNSRNTASISQYDTACLHQPQH
jgi:hypothetical protein